MPRKLACGLFNIRCVMIKGSADEVHMLVPAPRQEPVNGPAAHLRFFGLHVVNAEGAKPELLEACVLHLERDLRNEALDGVVALEVRPSPSCARPV